MRKVILPFVLLLFVFGCVKDENELSKDIKLNKARESKLESIEAQHSFLSFPEIENFSLDELATDTRFNDLKNTFGILQNKINVVSFNMQAADSTSTTSIKLDENTIKRIRYDDYVSYTMLMLEPDDTTGDFSNLIVQEHEGEKNMYTIRYFVSIDNENNSERQSASSSRSNIRILSGMRHFKDLYEHPDSSGGSPSCSEYETVCRVVSILVPTCCGCGHCGNTPCWGCSGTFAGWETEFREECEQVCAGLGIGVGAGSGGGGSSGSNDNSEPEEIATSPINPDGSDETCNNVAKTVKDKAFKEKIDYLKTKTGEKQETGFLQSKDGTFTPLTNVNNGHSLHIPTLTDMKGYMHTHLDDFEVPDKNGDGIPEMIKPIKIFSPADVISLLTMSKRTLSNNINLMEVYGMVVTSNKTFVLKYIGDPLAIPNSFPAEEEMEKIYKSKIIKNQNDLPKGLLLFAFENMKVSDLKVFELKPDGTIEKTELDAQKNIVKSTC